MGEGTRGRIVTDGVRASEDDEKLARILQIREQGLNRQLGITMLAMSIAYGLCLVCSLTGVFLTGRTLGILGFLPGMLLLLTGAIIAAVWGGREKSSPIAKHWLLILLYLAILDVSLIQLVWAVPCLVGFIAMVYAYHNVKINVFYNVLVIASVFIMAALNAAFGMPNPDMLPYPSAIADIPDGYVTLWAMAHPEQWSRFDYFIRILRFHSLPFLFLLFIVAGFGYAMSRRTWQRLTMMIARERRIREIETCLLLMAGGMRSHELLKAVLGEQCAEMRANSPLSQEFVDSIPAAEIPCLMKRFRKRCADDPEYAEFAARDPEGALKSL